MGSQPSTSRYFTRSSEKRFSPGGTENLDKKKMVDCEIIDIGDDEIMVIDDKKGKAKGISSSFKKFDIVDDCSDHHYVKPKKANPPTNWVKKIQAEWKILENDLPDAIFVRVYESRMDLLRAVIVGAEGTPYHDGLFFFDVCFPDNYPNSPPNVYYHSGGLRINPNLYASGKVCLSLLGTWYGSGKEEWLPGVSTMLQVLVSIQGLILNAEPYYNEPGYGYLRWSEPVTRNALQYNETTFIYNLQTMVYTMRRPPKNFEELVMSHFREHAHHILVSSKAYLDGARVGGGGHQGSCSEDYKCKLAKSITTLIGVFKQIGASGCDEFLSLPQRVNSAAPPRAPMSRNKKLGFVLCTLLFCLGARVFLVKI